MTTSRVLGLLRRCLLALLLLCSISGVASAQTVLSENFDTVGDYNRWTTSGSSSNWSFVTDHAEITGNGINASKGTITSPASANAPWSAATVSGTAYTVSFFASDSSGSAFTLNAGFNITNTVKTFTNIPISLTKFSFDFTATSAPTTIFFFANKANGSEILRLDTITVVKKVPELNAAHAQLPLTMLLGLGLILYDRRRSRVGCA